MFKDLPSGQTHFAGDGCKPPHVCPNVKRHTKHPESYSAHVEWADKKIESGYRQLKCPVCGLWEIWEKVIK